MLSNNLIDPSIQTRANTSVEWLSTDSLDNYMAFTSKHASLYSQHDIEYKFNSHGFRCDEFNIPSELPIVFLGCSFTEGIGVRQNETWSYLLLEKIIQQTNKNIPYWNLSLAGTGIDTQARNLYFLTTLLNKKIKFVFILLPPNRREYKAESALYKNWVPRQANNIAPLDTHINPIFSDSYFSTHQTERSLMIIDSIGRQNDTKICCATWDTLTDIKELTKSFPSIDSIEKFHWRKVDLARDSIHPGPVAHQLISNIYWQQIKKYFTSTIIT